VTTTSTGPEPRRVTGRETEGPIASRLAISRLIGRTVLNVGKRNYLIDGVSGSGKTTAASELHRRGYQAIHGDRQLMYRGDPTTSSPIEVPEWFPDDQARAGWISDHLCWPPAEVADLAANDEEPVTFFCGGSRNSRSFLHLFDAVFILEIDRDTLIQRLDERPEDEWAGRGRTAERLLALRLQQTRQDLPEGIPIDATRPVALVVDDILRRCGQLSG
jgi:gluconate kinase